MFLEKYGGAVRILGIDPGYATLGWGIIEEKANYFYLFIIKLDQIYGICQLPGSRKYQLMK